MSPKIPGTIVFLHAEVDRLVFSNCLFELERSGGLIPAHIIHGRQALTTGDSMHATTHTIVEHVGAPSVPLI